LIWSTESAVIRPKVQTTLVYGIHSVRQALMDSPEQALELWIQRGRHDAVVAEISSLAGRHTLAVQQVPRATLDRLAGGAPHQGVVLKCRRPLPLPETDLPSILGSRAGTPLLLVLDGVQDPHNLGACLRTAEAAAVDAVIIPRHRAVGLTGTVHKAASGAAETVSLIEVGNLARTVRELKEAGVWLIGADAHAQDSLYRVDLTLPIALVLGGEGRGLRRLTRELCDRLVRIPMHGRVASLNVSVAAGICLYEAVRQRGKLGG
jgi:23S rRNA (guanosine2251-2'-O)-methyltransferase